MASTEGSAVCVCVCACVCVRVCVRACMRVKQLTVDITHSLSWEWYSIIPECAHIHTHIYNKPSSDFLSALCA